MHGLQVVILCSKGYKACGSCVVVAQVQVEVVGAVAPDSGVSVDAVVAFCCMDNNYCAVCAGFSLVFLINQTVMFDF